MKHILIIDDDIHINHMLDSVLRQAGYRVSHAYSGTEALLFLAKFRPDLILLDLMLPGLSGEEILPQTADIPVIIMSAKVGVKGKVDLLLNGAADYITKPFEIDELLARIIVQFRKTSTKESTKILKYYRKPFHTYCPGRLSKREINENRICNIKTFDGKS